MKGLSKIDPQRFATGLECFTVEEWERLSEQEQRGHFRRSAVLITDRKPRVNGWDEEIIDKIIPVNAPRKVQGKI